MCQNKMQNILHNLLIFQKFKLNISFMQNNNKSHVFKASTGILFKSEIIRLSIARISSWIVVRDWKRSEKRKKTNIYIVQHKNKFIYKKKKREKDVDFWQACVFYRTVKDSMGALQFTVSGAYITEDKTSYELQKATRILQKDTIYRRRCVSLKQSNDKTSAVLYTTSE